MKQGAGVPGKISFETTEADYVSASRANFRCQLRSVAMWRRLASVCLVAGALVAAAGAIFDGDPVQALIIGTMSAGAGALAILPCIGVNYLLLPRRAGKLYRQQRSYRGPQELEWTDERLIWRGTGFTLDTPWRDYHRWRDTGQEFLLFLNDQMPHYIPRRALDAGQAEDLRATLVEHGPPRR